ncbi:Disorganized muscle protein 1 [Nymphon striatum]|nr:Disorganized muscle protein 1 [Nymphon striatum]
MVCCRSLQLRREDFTSALEIGALISTDLKQIDGIAPTFAQKPSIKQEEDGKRLLFECRILADPKPTVSWYHNGTIVEPVGRYKVIVEKDGNSYQSALQIDGVTVEDGGKYKVIAKNELGESNATISLNFDSDDLPAGGAKPTFTEKPVIRQSDDFNKIIFECRLVADPTPTISWRHAGQEVTDGGRFKYVISSDKHNHIVKLEISSVENEDGGEYKVFAKNKHGQGSANINLNFQGDSDKPKIPDGKIPRFPKKPTIRQAEDKLILECILEANPVPEIKWYHGTILIKEGRRHKESRKEISKDNYLLALEIWDPTQEDGGKYRCNACNELGESNANIALNFAGEPEKPEGLAPSLLEKPKIIPKDGGALIVMKIRVKCKPAPIATWYRGTTVVKETKRITIRQSSESDEEHTLFLEVEEPSVEDGGIYKCHIKNEHGETNANLNLNIEGEKKADGEAPSFMEKPRIIPEDGGKRIIMECKVKAKPKPTIIWYHGSTAVKETNRINMVVKEAKDVYVIRLELKDPSQADAGIYKCNVKNSVGESNANLTLNIEIAPPIIKERPKVVRIERHRRIVIECIVQSKNKPECLWFHEDNKVREDRRKNITVKEVNQGEFTVSLEIDKPDDADIGSYKLVAKNDKGESISQTCEVDLPDEKKKDEEK